MDCICQSQARFWATETAKRHSLECQRPPEIRDHTLPEMRKSVQDFIEVLFDTQIGARTWRILCSFRPHTCAYMDTSTLHWK
jgi:hypothetical protein